MGVVIKTPNLESDDLDFYPGSASYLCSSSCISFKVRVVMVPAS